MLDPHTHTKGQSPSRRSKDGLKLPEFLQKSNMRKIQNVKLRIFRWNSYKLGFVCIEPRKMQSDWWISHHSIASNLGKTKGQKAIFYQYIYEVNYGLSFLNPFFTLCLGSKPLHVHIRLRHFRAVHQLQGGLCKVHCRKSIYHSSHLWVCHVSEHSENFRSRKFSWEFGKFFLARPWEIIFKFSSPSRNTRLE